MTDHPNVQRMRDGYVAFGKGDLAALEDLLTEDVVWHVAGRSSLAGTYSGRTAVFEFFGKIMEITEGSFRAEPLTLLADDHYGCAPVRITAHRGDRHLDVMNVQASRLEDGRVAEFWDTTTDTEATEAFYA
jgi:ketosteroid isomerase-like protein